MISDILGYKGARTLSKAIILVLALAFSTFALSGAIFSWMNFNFFIQVRSIIAVLAIIMIFMVKEDIPIPYIFHLRDIPTTRWIYYILFGIITLDIAPINFFLSPILTYPLLGYSLFALRNVIAVILVLYAKTIHDSG